MQARKLTAPEEISALYFHLRSTITDPLFRDEQNAFPSKSRLLTVLFIAAHPCCAARKKDP